MTKAGEKQGSERQAPEPGLAALDVRCLLDIWAETSSRRLDGRELGPERECGRDVAQRAKNRTRAPHTFHSSSRHIRQSKNKRAKLLLIF